MCPRNRQQLKGLDPTGPLCSRPRDRLQFAGSNSANGTPSADMRVARSPQSAQILDGVGYPVTKNAFAASSPASAFSCMMRKNRSRIDVKLRSSLISLPLGSRPRAQHWVGNHGQRFGSARRTDHELRQHHAALLHATVTSRHIVTRQPQRNPGLQSEAVEGAKSIDNRPRSPFWFV